MMERCALTKEEFLTDPVLNLRGDIEHVPTDWISEAWKQDGFRVEAIEALARSVSKGGTFTLANSWLRLLSAALSSPDDVVALYEQIRNKSGRDEMEWREAFERAFPEHKADLPNIDLDRVVHYFAFECFWSIATGSIPRVKELVDKARAQHVALSKCCMLLKYFRPAAVNVESMKKIPESEDERIWTPIELATKLGEYEIVRILQQA